MKGRGHSEDLGIDEKVLEWILEKEGGKVWLRIGTSGWLL
jgi:hypothetical protein